MFHVVAFLCPNTRCVCVCVALDVALQSSAAVHASPPTDIGCVSVPPLQYRGAVILTHMELY